MRTGDEKPSRQATMLLSVLPSLEPDLIADAYIIITDEVIHIHRLA